MPGNSTHADVELFGLNNVGRAPCAMQDDALVRARSATNARAMEIALWVYAVVAMQASPKSQRSVSKSQTALKIPNPCAQRASAVVPVVSVG